MMMSVMGSSLHHQAGAEPFPNKYHRYTSKFAILFHIPKIRRQIVKHFINFLFL